MFVVDDLISWLIGRLADAGYQKLSTWLRGSDQARALKGAVAAAVQATVDELGPSDGDEADRVAEQINKAFRRRDPVPLPTGQPTLLEALQAGIAEKLAVADDAGQAAVSLPGVPVSEVAAKLTGHLVREIQMRGSRGGPLADLADQLNHDVTHLQGQRIEGMLARVLEWLGEGLALPSSAVGPVGWPIAEVADPFALEVHHPVEPDVPRLGLPVLPVYVPREHDAALAEVVTAAAAGASGIAVLVGGSSTGKTRACWQALQLLRDRPEQWRLWHPINPSRPDAARHELPAIGPRTVVWLNEAQFYLETADPKAGEQVAAGLRELLRDPARKPVLVLATLWPEFWDTLTRRPQPDQDDPHAQARDLLSGSDITVPPAFTAAQLQQARKAGDPRLAQAAEGAEDGQVIQYLAGAPELLARYRNAPPAAKALISAAMDARRLGAGIGLPLDFLQRAAPGYLANADWDQLDDDWLEQALAYTAVPYKGARGPLTRIRPRPASSRATQPGPRDTGEQMTGGQAGIPGMPLYRLADYLDQHGRRTRKRQFPPADFWAAAAACALPSDQATLGDAAHDRGLYRIAAQLHKNAAARGNLRAVSYLMDPPDCLHGDESPLRWAAVHVPLNDPETVAALLDRLRAAGAQEQVTVLLGRDPAAGAPLEDPQAVAWLLDSLLRAGAQEQVATLAARAAAGAPLEDPQAVAWLLDSLLRAGAQEQVAVLLGRDPARRAPLDNPGAVARLLDSLREADAQEQVTVLLGRDPARRAPLDSTYAVARLLDSLRYARAQEQFAALADGVSGQAPLEDPDAVAGLLYMLRAAGAQEQFTALADRVSGQAPLEDPYAVAGLLDSLRWAGAQEQAAALAARAAAHVPLDDPYAVARLLDNLRAAGAQEQAAAMLGRDPAAHVPLDDPYAVAGLLDSLRWAGAQEQAAALAARAAAQAPLDDPEALAGLLDRLREADAQEQVTVLLGRDPARRAPLDDPYAVARLLDSLREADAQEQVTVLLGRDPARRAPLDDPGAVARLLDSLREADAQEQVTVLLGRDPARRAPLDDPGAVARLLDSLRYARAQEQFAALADRVSGQAPLEDLEAVAGLLYMLRAAGAQEQFTALADRVSGQAPLEDPHAVDRLLDSLWEIGAPEQAAALAESLPGAGMFHLFLAQEGKEGNQDRFRFGREADGSPAEPWRWQDLD